MHSLSRIALACLLFAASAIEVLGNNIKINMNDGKYYYFPEDEFEPLDGPEGNTGSEGCAFSKLVRGPEGFDYEDGIKEIRTDGPNPRVISNAFNQAESIPSPNMASDWLWQWGQFIDHDFSLVFDNGEEMEIDIPHKDGFFPSNVKKITLLRSEFEIDDEGVAQQINSIASHINAGTVYGNSERLGSLLATDALDTNGGTGRLKTSTSEYGVTDLLPLNNGLENFIVGNDENNGAGDLGQFFLAGDIRANDHLNLIVTHTLWVREHNYWADTIRDENEDLTGQQVFDLARLIVQSEIQHITYNEFLPLLLGIGAIPSYSGYDPHVNAGALNIGATCAYRVGHTLVSPSLLTKDSNGAEAFIAFEDGFFNPGVIKAMGLDPFLRGLSSQVCQKVDPFINSALRNELFGTNDDLFSRNIQRGRDHGLPTYNDIREAYLGGVSERLENTTDAFFDDDVFQEGTGSILAELYDSPDDVDCFVGLLSEMPVDGAMLGPTHQMILSQQFKDLRDSNPFWYEKRLHGKLLQLVKDTKLSHVIKRNADVAGSLDDVVQDNVFIVPSDEPV
ncbi:hypothetical protein ACHAXR_007901 [Thalassiosira sp. AJA248-18]